MANQIRPLARLFRGMADLIDCDHTSQTRYEAIAKAAGVVAARATAEELVAGRLWQVDGADLLAAAYAFHAGLPRQAAAAARPGHAAAGVGAGWRPAAAAAAPFPAQSAWDGRPRRLDSATGFPSALHRAARGPASAAQSSPW